MFGRNQSKGRPPSIIICDDEPHICKLISEHLSDVGYDVRIAKDGQECLDEVVEEMPDAMILDLKMPRMNGIEVIRELRKMNASMPILILSGFHDLGHEVEIKELSLGVFTGKPFRLSEVTELLESALLELKDSSGADFEVPTRTDDLIQ